MEGGAVNGSFAVYVRPWLYLGRTQATKTMRISGGHFGSMKMSPALCAYEGELQGWMPAKRLETAASTEVFLRAQPKQGPVIQESRKQCVVCAQKQLSIEGCTSVGWEGERNLEQLLSSGMDFDAITSLLRHHGAAKALLDVRRVHVHIKRLGYDSTTYLGNFLVEAYSNCGNLMDAQTVFDNIQHPNSYSWNILMKGYAQNRSLNVAMTIFERMPQRDVVSWNTMIAAYAINSHGTDALELFHLMQIEEVKPNNSTFVSVLDACATLLAVKDGRNVHAMIVGYGCDQDVIVGSALINMYGKCGSLEDARTVFSRMSQCNVVSWSAMIFASAQNGHNKEALGLFSQMQAQGIKPDKITFISVLDACTVLEDGQEMHLAIVNSGFEQDICVGNALINMYGKCRNFTEASKTFVRMPQQDVVSWTALITMYVDNAYDKEALELFHQMRVEGVKPNKITYLAILNLCTSWEEGSDIHIAIIYSGYTADGTIGNALINMYGKNGGLSNARNIFLSMHQPDVVSWTAMISACARNGSGKEALTFFFQMQSEGLRPNNITYICVLDACAMLAAEEVGQQIHSAVVESKYNSDAMVGTAVIHMYGKCGRLDDARNVFNRMPERIVSSWNAMVTVCTQNGGASEALELFDQMLLDGVQPDKVTFLCVIDACISLMDLEEGQRVHAAIVDGSHESDQSLGNALIDMYGKFGSLHNARTVFCRMPDRDVISWSAMIAACIHSGHGKKALESFYQMQLEGVEPNKVTFTCVLDACASQGALEKGREIHFFITEKEFLTETIVENALLNMYGKCGSLEDARCIFGTMLERDIISWSSMITICTHNGHGKEALQLFRQMRLGGVQPNQITFLCILDACTKLAALEEGQAIHAEIVEGGYEANTIVGTALINMYGKCGNLGAAKSVHGRILGPNVVSWTALITTYAKNGCGNKALQLFQEMQLEGVKPNDVTFISVLTACSHTGQVDDGRRYFMSMYKDYGMAMALQHYMCMIDLLSRAGHLEEAEELIKKLSYGNLSVAWSTLLGSCRTHHDVERGVRAASCCFVMDPKNARPYVMLSNIFAAAGRWDDVVKVRDALKHAVLPEEDSSKVSKMMHELTVGGVFSLKENDRWVELQS